MTQKEMIDQVRKYGCTASVKDGEIRVNLQGGTEATAYYTTDREDAVHTAWAMSFKPLQDESTSDYLARTSQGIYRK